MTGTLTANRKDICGSTRGGIRYPYADCPTASCQSYAVHEDNKTLQMMFGTVKPFSKEHLKNIYGTLKKLLEGYGLSENFVGKEDGKTTNP